MWNGSPYRRRQGPLKLHPTSLLGHLLMLKSLRKPNCGIRYDYLLTASTVTYGIRCLLGVQQTLLHHLRRLRSLLKLTIQHYLPIPLTVTYGIRYGFFFLSTQDVSSLHAYVFSLGLLSTRGFKHCLTDPLERSLVLPSGPGYCLKSRVQMSLFGRMRMRAGFRSPE